LGVILKTKTRFLFEEPKHKPRFPIDFHPVFILKVFIPWPSRENHDFCYHPTLHFHVWNKPMTILNSRITHVPTLSKLKVLAYSNFQQGVCPFHDYPRYQRWGHMIPWEFLRTLTPWESDLVVHFIITSGIKGVSIWYLGPFSRSWFSHKLELLILIERIGLMIIDAIHENHPTFVQTQSHVICKIYFIQNKMYKLFSYCWWRCCVKYVNLGPHTHISP